MAIYEAYDDKIINRVGGGGSPTPSGYTINISASSSELYGQTIDVYSGGTKLTELTFSNSGSATLTVQNTGTYTFSVTITTMTYSSSVTVTEAINTYNTTIQYYPNGSTVIPTDDISIWLACGQRSETYTTLAEVLADSTCLSALMADSNAVDYLVRSKSFIGNEALVPTMTSDTAPSGECFASTVHSVSEKAYCAFDGNDSTTWESANNSVTNEYIGYQFTSAVCVNKISIKSGTNAQKQPKNYKLQGSNDGTTYTDIPDTNGNVTLNGFNGSTTSTVATHTFNNSTKYLYYRLYIGTNWGGANIDITTMQFGFDGICQSSSAMTYIGLNNYASNTLLADSDWRTAICNSAYFESVLNVKVPTMTNNTTPSGECFATNDNATAYYAFDGQISENNIVTLRPLPGKVGYKFTSPVHVCLLQVWNRKTYGGRSIASCKLQGSNDNGVTYEDITSELTNTDTTPEKRIFNLPINYGAAYNQIALNVIDSLTHDNEAWIAEIQFYGRKDL